MTEIKEKDISSYEYIKIRMAVAALIDVFDLMKHDEEKYHIKITFEKSVK